MRTWLALPFLLAILATGACRSSCGSPCSSCAAPPQPCQPCQPCCAYGEPVYSGGCAGDPGIYREGTGAFAR